MPPADHSPPFSSPFPASASQNYGADAAGLICGYLLGTDTPPQEVDSAQAARWLASLQAGAAPADQFLWLHFNLSHAQAMRCISSCVSRALLWNMGNHPAVVQNRCAMMDR